jgi:hypothetical protein
MREQLGGTLTSTAVRRLCYGIATVFLRYCSHVDRDPHGSNTGAIPEQYRSTTVELPSRQQFPQVFRALSP